MKRCECGRIIWPWQRTVRGFEASLLHEACIDPSETVRWGWCADTVVDALDRDGIIEKYVIETETEERARLAVAFDPGGRVLVRQAADGWAEVIPEPGEP